MIITESIAPADIESWRKLLRIAHENGEAAVASWIADRIIEAKTARPQVITYPIRRTDR